VEPTEVAAKDSFEVQVIGQGNERAISLRQPDAALGKVVENRVLTESSTQEKRHIGRYLIQESLNLITPSPEFELPPGMSYSAGDYLAILPTNPPQSVKRALKHFNLSEEVSYAIMKLGS